VNTRAKRLSEPFGVDRQLADVLRELNELRRSRSLSQYHQATTTAAKTLQRRPAPGVSQAP